MRVLTRRGVWCWCAAGSLPGEPGGARERPISASDGPVGSRPAVATPSGWGIGTGWLAGRTGRRSPALLLLHASRPRLFRWAPWRRGRIMKSWLEILLLLARCPPYYCVQQLQAAQADEPDEPGRMEQEASTSFGLV